MAGTNGRQIPNYTENHNGKQKDVDDWGDHSAGITAISSRINELYPDQKNHIQATALVKFCNGGIDPLDYVSILSNPGDSKQGIPPHWHYVSFGLTDLHGDNRVHQFTGEDQQSGFGFEMTFRLKKETPDESLPMWPSVLLNSLAKYIFKTGNNLGYGDFIPWDSSINNEENSAMTSMLVTDDPQLKPVSCPNGTFHFRQIVGVTHAEMKAAREWNGKEVIEMMKQMPEVGGPYMITDMTRKKSMFQIMPTLQKKVDDAIKEEGSNLGHVTAICRWDDAVEKNPNNVSKKKVPEDSDDEEEIEISSIHLKFDLDAAELLKLVAIGRLRKERYFVFQNVSGQVMIFIPPDFDADMVYVDSKMPLKVKGDVVQIYCSSNFTDQLVENFSPLQYQENVLNSLPKSYDLKNPNIRVTVYPPGQLPPR